MLKKTVTYTNPFTNEEVTEEHYFHISKADLVEMEMESLKEPEVREPNTGERLTGFRAKLQRIINSEDGVAIMEVVKQMIRRSYGVKQGDKFIKNAENWQEFASSEAYSQMFFELCTDAKVQADFMNNILPRELEQEAARIAAQAQDSPETAVAVALGEKEEDPTGLTDETTPRVLTQAQMVEMDSDELKSGLATGRYKLS